MELTRLVSELTSTMCRLGRSYQVVHEGGSIIIFICLELGLLGAALLPSVPGEVGRSHRANRQVGLGKKESVALEIGIRTREVCVNGYGCR